MESCILRAGKARKVEQRREVVVGMKNKGEKRIGSFESRSVVRNQEKRGLIERGSETIRRLSNRASRKRQIAV